VPAEENLGHSSTTLLARIVVVQQNRHVGKPAAHVHAAATGERHNRARIGRGHSFHQRILAPGQREGAIMPLALTGCVEAHRKNYHVRQRCVLFCLRRNQIRLIGKPEPKTRAGGVGQVVGLDADGLIRRELERGVLRHLPLGVDLFENLLAVDEYLEGIFAAGSRNQQIFAGAARTE
jgi:hypothetical protein